MRRTRGPRRRRSGGEHELGRDVLAQRSAEFRHLASTDLGGGRCAGRTGNVVLVFVFVVCVEIEVGGGWGRGETWVGGGDGDGV